MMRKLMSKATIVLSLVTLITFPGQVLAEDAMREFANNREVIQMGLYPPGIIMRQQRELGITGPQRKRIAALVRDFQGKVAELQWEMPSEQQELRELLQQASIDEAQAVAQANKVLQMESEFKLENFKLLIALKNELTPEQTNLLDKAIKRRMERMREARQN